MATKFSQFADGGILRITDIVVGLRDGVNTQMDMIDGIKDDNGNYLLGFSSVASATNYITFTNAITGGAPIIGVNGVLPNIPLAITTQGAGNITMTPGTSGEVIIPATTSIQVPSGTTLQRPSTGAGGKFRYNTDTDYLEYWDESVSAWVIIISGAAFDTATYVTNTDETADLPNSQPLSALATGIAYVTTTTGIVGTRTLTGTANQITVSNGTGSGGNPTFSITDNPILPGTGSVQLPDGTTAQRAGAAGSVRYNTTTSLSELTNDGATWAAIATTSGASIPAVILGDTLYGSAVNVLSALAGNTTTTKQYLSQTGTGAVSAAPAWSTISGSDITGAALTVGNDTNVTLTLGGTPATALLRAASVTAGWTGTLAETRGGTAQSTYTTGDMLYASAANTLSKLAITNSAALVSTNAGAPAWTSSLTNGQIIIGSTGSTPVAASLTAGSGITITPGAGSIEIAASGSGTVNAGSQYQLAYYAAAGTTLSGIGTVRTQPLIVNNANSSSITLAPGNLYVCNNGASLITFTLPSSASTIQGDCFEIQGGSPGGWRIAQNASQFIYYGASTTTTGVGGSLQNLDSKACVTVKASGTGGVQWVVVSGVGQVTIV